MNHRSIATGAAKAIALAFALTSTALAQQGGPEAPKPVALLENVEGNVLVSNATGLAAGSNGASLVARTRVITTANSRALVKFDNGCSVKLEPNQRFVVDPTKSCEQLLLLAQSTLPAPPLPPVAPTNLAGVAVSGGLPDAAGYFMGGIAGATAIIRWRQDENVSPN